MAGRNLALHRLLRTVEFLINHQVIIGNCFGKELRQYGSIRQFKKNPWTPILCLGIRGKQRLNPLGGPPKHVQSGSQCGVKFRWL